MMVPHVPAPAQRAALALHALAADDRAWVLGALPADQQAVIEPLLRELEDLGIPRDAGLLDTAVRCEGDRGAAAADALRALDAAQVRRLAGLLAGEPPRLAAALLAASPWPWREQLLQHLPAAVACEVVQHASPMRPAPALQLALLSEISAALETAPAPRQAVPLWRSMVRSLRRTR
jgi:hypothetical protein